MIEKEEKYHPPHRKRGRMMKDDITENIKIILDNHQKCFYGFCEDCIFYKDCNKNNCGCDCSKFHLDKIRTLINSILPD